MVSEVYLEYLISGILNVTHTLTAPTGELLGLIYSCECLFFALLLLPAYLIYLFFVPKDKFLDKAFSDREGAIYKDTVKTGKKLEMAYYVIYIIRRMIYVSLPYWLEI